MDIKKRISNLAKVYRTMLEEEEKTIAETIGKPDKHNEWMEAVNSSTCHKGIVEDLEKILAEIEEEGDDGK